MAFGDWVSLWTMITVQAREEDEKADGKMPKE